MAYLLLIAMRKKSSKKFIFCVFLHLQKVFFKYRKWAFTLIEIGRNFTVKHNSSSLFPTTAFIYFVFFHPPLDKHENFPLFPKDFLRLFSTSHDDTNEWCCWEGKEIFRTCVEANNSKSGNLLSPRLSANNKRSTYHEEKIFIPMLLTRNLLQILLHNFRKFVYMDFDYVRFTKIYIRLLAAAAAVCCRTIIFGHYFCCCSFSHCACADVLSVLPRCVILFFFSWRKMCILLKRNMEEHGNGVQSVLKRISNSSYIKNRASELAVSVWW